MDSGIFIASIFKRALLLFFAYVIFSIIGKFTKKQLNPAYEDLIEKRMDKVTLLSLTYYAACVGLFSIPFFLIFRSNVPLYLISSVLVTLSIAWYCGYCVASLKGFSDGHSTLWGLLSLSGIGFLVLGLCISYRHVGEPVTIPIYKGKLLKFKCQSCGSSLHDYECNVIGNSCICPKCKSEQVVSK